MKGELDQLRVDEKGNFGEIKMHEHYEKDGYTVISKNPTRDINAKGHKGIDGVYYKKDGHPPYIIGEAKYGSGSLSTLADGTKQMSKEWIFDRLMDTVDLDTYLDILDKGYKSNLCCVNKEGNVIIKLLM